MTIERASDNPFPSVLMVEGTPTALADNPAAGQRRLAVGTDHLLYLVDPSGVATQVGGASGLSDPMTTRGDLIIRNASNVTARLGRGSASQVLMSDGTDIAWATPSAGSTYYAPPTVTNYGANFAGSGTTVAVAVTAPTTGDKLVAVIMATGRGATSITQTNVVWTQRYTGNGNGVWLEVWTGVCTGTGGTTATANFTGSNVNYAEVFTVNSAASAFTAASASTTGTSSSAVLAPISASGLTAGHHYIVATSAGSAIASSYSGVSHEYIPLTVFGGLARSGILRTNATALSYWSIGSSGGAYFAAIIHLT